MSDNAFARLMKPRTGLASCASLMTMLSSATIADARADRLGRPPGVIRYVDDGAPAGGDGLSWSTAHRFLQDALAASQPGSGVTELRIGQGVQKPDRSNLAPGGTGSRYDTFTLIAGVTIRGGYAGAGAPDPGANDPDLYATFLDGDLFGNDGPNFTAYFENSLHICTATSLTAPVTLEGLRLRGGNASINQNFHNYGAALFINGSAVTLRGCILEENSARFGAAAYADNSTLVLEDCIVRGNLGTGFGGGAVNSALGGSLTIANCEFSLNDGNFAGAIGTGVPTTITQSAFHQNHAVTGGALYCNEPAQQVHVADCLFEENTVESRGAAIFASSVAAMEVEACVFRNNASDHSGGAVEVQQGHYEFADCEFTGNAAGAGSVGEGGAVRNYGATITFTDTAFTDNEADPGVVHCENAPMTSFFDCTFTGNRFVAVDAEQSGVRFARCEFSDNVSNGLRLQFSNNPTLAILEDCVFRNHSDGPALQDGGQPLRAERCTFIDNDAQGSTGGGGVHVYSCATTWINCRFLGNQVTGPSGRGGGVRADSSANCQFINCEFIGNSAARGGGVFAEFAAITMRNCLVANNTATAVGPSAGGLCLTGSSASLQLRNSILWQNRIGASTTQAAQLSAENGAALAVNHSDVQSWTGSLGGIGNLGVDPRFRDPDGDDETIGTADDDFRLLSISPCIDAADNAAIGIDAGDLDGDGDVSEPTPLDLLLRDRRVDHEGTPDTGLGTAPIVDMGPHEFSIPPCPADIAPPVSPDGMVDVDDLLAVINAWGACANPDDCPADIAPIGPPMGDDAVDVDDLLVVINAWGPCE